MENINLNELTTEELEMLNGGLTTSGLLWHMGTGAVGGAFAGGPAGAVFGACFGATDYVISGCLG